MKKVKSIIPFLCELRPSKILSGEVGAFAVRNIKKGLIISRSDSPEAAVSLPLRYFKKLDKITREKINSFSALDKNKEYRLPADLNNMGASWYFNHSCSPNMAFDRQANLVALRNIKKDEELTFDYGWIFDEKFKMKCACGSPNCRKVVTGLDLLDPEFRKYSHNKMWPDTRLRVALTECPAKQR
ncbi:MAG: SET domain-containing protein-lysine N-methyltransferase [Patescibacteria group bacterium]|jgi:hypothetical protein